MVTRILHFIQLEGSKVIFGIENHKINFHEASFEVYYVSVSQTLAILGFSPQIFFILTYQRWFNKIIYNTEMKLWAVL